MNRPCRVPYCGIHGFGLPVTIDIPSPRSLREEQCQREATAVRRIEIVRDGFPDPCGVADRSFVATPFLGLSPSMLAMQGYQAQL